MQRSVLGRPLSKNVNHCATIDAMSFLQALLGGTSGFEESPFGSTSILQAVAEHWGLQRKHLQDLNHRQGLMAVLRALPQVVPNKNTYFLASLSLEKAREGPCSPEGLRA